jgi:hemolysin-activating ACP:hemolysin acyltransferase
MSTRRGLLLAPKKSPDNRIMEKRGVIAHLMAKSKQYRNLPFSALSVRVDPALVTNQLAIFYRWNDGVAVGYVTWALLAPDVEQRWVNAPKGSLHASEWNEGETLWLMDFLALPGYCEDIVEFISQNMFAGHAQAYSLRRNLDGSVRKISCWKRRNIFLQRDMKGGINSDIA